MGKKSWFSAVKKAIRLSRSKKDKRSHKSKSNPKKSCHGNQMSVDTCLSQTKAPLANPPEHYPPKEETELKQPENEQIKRVCSVSYVTTKAEVAEDAASNAAAAEVNCMTQAPRFLGKSREEGGAIKIQTAYRAHKARRVFRALRAQKRLNSYIQGLSVKRQTASTIMRMQAMARVQSQVRTRRIRMAEVNEALQRQLHQKREKELEKQGFDLSPRSKEQVDAMLQSRKDAAERRERALAYAFSRQKKWRNSAKSASPMNTGPNYFDWEWNWSERWNAVRPWETGTTSNKKSVTDTGKRASSQSPSMPPSKERKLVSSPMARGQKGPTKSTKSGSRVSNPGPSPLGLGKKGGPNTISGAELAKKQALLSNSPSSGGKKSMGAPKKSIKTIR